MVTLVHPLGQDVAVYDQIAASIAEHFRDGTQARYAWPSFRTRMSRRATRTPAIGQCRCASPGDALHKLKLHERRWACALNARRGNSSRAMPSTGRGHPCCTWRPGCCLLRVPVWGVLRFQSMRSRGARPEWGFVTMPSRSSWRGYGRRR